MKVYEKELKEEAKKQKEVRHSHSQTHHALIFFLSFHCEDGLLFSRCLA